MMMMMMRDFLLETLSVRKKSAINSDLESQRLMMKILEMKSLMRKKIMERKTEIWLWAPCLSCLERWKNQFLVMLLSSKIEFLNQKKQQQIQFFILILVTKTKN